MNSTNSNTNAPGVVESIKDTLVSMQHELTSSVQKLRIGATQAPSLQMFSDESIASIGASEEGNNLMLKYQLHLQQIHDMGAEAARLSNVCSTRMGNLHQLCNEHGTAMIDLGENLRSLPATRAQIRQINRDLDKISRFLLQTEIALKNLESIHEKSVQKEVAAS